MSEHFARRRQALTASVLLTFTASFWAGNAVVGRALHTLIPPVSLAFWRWALASLLLLPFAWRHLRRDWPTIRATWPMLLVLAVLGVSCFNTMLYQAAQTTPATSIALIQTAMPAVIVLLGLVLFGERISRMAGVGVLLSIAGAVIVVLHGEPAALADLELVPGDLWMIAAVVLYGTYTVLLRRRPPVYPLSLLAVTFVVGDLLLLPLYLWERAIADAMVLDKRVVAGVLYVAVFPSILAYLFWNRGVQVIGPARAGLFICLVPVFASALAVVFLGERLHAYHLIGLALILLGFLLVHGWPHPDGQVG